MSEKWVDEVLDFWFKELTAQDWFGGDKTLDETIKTRFKPLYQDMRSNFRVDSVEDARTALAAIILFDQFPRNIYRGSPAAFGTDDMALGLSRRALDREFDRQLSETEKQFMYMPFMHSEVMADQERCVDLFRSLGNENGLKFAIEHRDMVAKYGRFPHRNKALGRESTAAEVELLESHPGYGQ